MRLPFAGLRPPPELTDRHLLDRFRRHRDEAAFTELVRRHGPLVWGVCRRTLAPADAEDAFQATFLLLVRKPPAGETLAPWLYRVAVLTARTARRADRRRQLRVRVGLPAGEPAAPVRENVRDDLDAALMGLSARDRAAVVLCHLEGHTRAEAAKRLGVPEGTLSARLSRALARLRLGAVPAVAVPAGLSTAAVRAGSSYLAGGAVPPAVATITRGVLTMGVLKSMTAAGLLLVAVAGAGVGVGLRAGPDDKPAAGEEAKLEAEIHQRGAALDRITAEADTLYKRQLAEIEGIRAAQEKLRNLRHPLTADRDRLSELLVRYRGRGQYEVLENYGVDEARYSVNSSTALTRLVQYMVAGAEGRRPVQLQRFSGAPEGDIRTALVACRDAGLKRVKYWGSLPGDLRTLAPDAKPKTGPFDTTPILPETFEVFIDPTMLK